MPANNVMNQQLPATPWGMVDLNAYGPGMHFLTQPIPIAMPDTNAGAPAMPSYDPGPSPSESNQPPQDRWTMGDDGRLVDAQTGQHKIQAKPRKQTLMGGTPFGGYRANGGPVMPGRAYVVGERGPELMVPQVPGTVIPNPIDRRIQGINARRDSELANDQQYWKNSAQDWNRWGKQSQQNLLSAQEERNRYAPGSPEWQAANTRMNNAASTYKTEFEGEQQAREQAAQRGALIGTGQGWQDYVELDRRSQQNAEAGMARVRERQSQRPGGANFVGPMPMPVVERPAMPANSDGVGRLVPSSSGGVKWQAGAGPGATPPPQSQPAMPVIPAAMAAPRPMQAPGSRIAQSPANRPYAEMPGSSGSLANRGVRAIGRSANDPERALEMAMRRARSQGDLEGAARMAQSNAWLNARMGGGGMGPMNRPAMPAMPGLVPAQTQRKPTWAGSMPPSDTGVESSGAMQPRSMPLMPSSVTNSQPSVPRPSTEPEPVDMFQRDPLGNYVNPQAAMVPSGFNAMNEFNAAHGLPPPPPGLYGAEAPPLVSSTPIPGTDQVMPMVKGEPKGAPVNRAQPPKPATWEAPKMYDETIPEVRDANGNVTRPAQTRQYYFVQDPQTGKPRKEYALDANGDGVPDNQQPGWQSWLDAQP